MIVFTVVVLLILILALWNYPIVLASTISSLSLFFSNLFPSLFVLLVFFKLLLNRQSISFLKKLFPPLSFSIILYTLTGIIMGFAGNTLLLNDAYHNKQISDEELQFITTRVCVPSATFIIFGIGTALNSYFYGVLLFLIQAGITIIFVSIHPPLHKITINHTFQLRDINTIFIQIGNGLFMLFCYVTVLSCINALITLPLSNEASLTVLCFMEFASSSLQIASLPVSFSLKLPVISAILGFGSFSAHIQTKVLADYTYSYPDFLKYRIIQCILSVLLSFLLVFAG